MSVLSRSPLRHVLHGAPCFALCCRAGSDFDKLQALGVSPWAYSGLVGLSLGLSVYLLCMFGDGKQYSTALEFAKCRRKSLTTPGAGDLSRCSPATC